MINQIVHSGHKNRIYLIPNPFETSHSFSNKRKRQILFLGRINPIKNIHSLFDILVDIDDVKYIIAGEANLKDEIKYLEFLKNEVIKFGLENKVVFLGKISGKNKFKLISSSKCLVLPSYSENFGNVVLESLSQATPVIASLGTPWEI